jgi:hypothetical protein
MGVAVALDRLRGRGERDGLHPGQDVGHLKVEERHGSEEDALLAGFLAGVVALIDGDRARIRIAFSPLRAHRFRARNAP